jgi:hypothetical protein
VGLDGPGHAMQILKLSEIRTIPELGDASEGRTREHMAGAGALDDPAVRVDYPFTRERLDLAESLAVGSGEKPPPLDRHL